MIRGDARQLVRHIPSSARGRVALVVTAPPYWPSIHGHARPGGAANYNNRYSADPANLAHTGPGDLADGITQILVGWRGIPAAKLQGLLARSTAERPALALFVLSGFLSNPARPFIAGSAGPPTTGASGTSSAQNDC